MNKQDRRPRPGDFVMPRGGKPIEVWRHVDPRTNGPTPVQRAGTVAQDALGLVIGSLMQPKAGMQCWTYVLWSNPTIIGWTYDGMLRAL